MIQVELYKFKTSNISKMFCSPYGMFNLLLAISCDVLFISQGSILHTPSSNRNRFEGSQWSRGSIGESSRSCSSAVLGHSQRAAQTNQSFIQGHYWKSWTISSLFYENVLFLAYKSVSLPWVFKHRLSWNILNLWHVKTDWSLHFPSVSDWKRITPRSPSDAKDWLASFANSWHLQT